jgi:hypothetical protein
MALHQGLGLLMLYGGEGYEVDQLPAINITHKTRVNRDTWVYNLSTCVGRG